MIWNPWKEIKRLRETMEKNDAIARENFYTIANLKSALHAIAAMETPRCSNVVRKAARVAREALDK